MKEVTQLNGRKIADCLQGLKSGTKVGLIFRHGVGDILMFLPYFDRLKALYGGLVIHLLIVRDYEGQLYEKRDDLVRFRPADAEAVFGRYDCLFELKFREGTPQEVFGGLSRMTKPDISFAEEIGLDPRQIGAQACRLQRHKSKYIGFMFNRLGKGFTEDSNVPYALAKYLWLRTKHLGFIPIEIMFMNRDYTVNESAKKYDFVDRTTRDLDATFENVISVFDTLRGICAIDCGFFHIAYSYFSHKNILYLQLTAPLGYLTKFDDIPNFNFLQGEKFSDRKFTDWLLNCDGGKIDDTRER